MRKKWWTEADDAFLRSHLNEMTDREIGQALGRSKSSIRNRLTILGITRPADVRARMMQKTQFRKGQASWNRGMKGIRMSPRTEFKKGNKPASTKHDGAITIRNRNQTPYQYIRISECNWRLLHRKVWEDANGPIPRGHVIRFKNGDTLDVRLENLECISRSEHAMRNQNREKARKTLVESDSYIISRLAPRDKHLQEKLRHFPHLVELKKEQLKLKRAIREAEREA